MRSWNLIAWVKILFITFFAFFYMSSSIGFNIYKWSTFIFQIPLTIASTAVIGYILSRFIQMYFKGKIVKPLWNENPLILKKPMIYFQFLSVGSIAFGIAMVIWDLYCYQIISQIGIQLISAGIGFSLTVSFGVKYLHKYDKS